MNEQTTQLLIYYNPVYFCYLFIILSYYTILGYEQNGNTKCVRDLKLNSPEFNLNNTDWG